MIQTIIAEFIGLGSGSYVCNPSSTPACTVPVRNHHIMGVSGDISQTDFVTRISPMYMLGYVLSDWDIFQYHPTWVNILDPNKAVSQSSVTIPSWNRHKQWKHLLLTYYVHIWDASPRVTGFWDLFTHTRSSVSSGFTWAEILSSLGWKSSLVAQHLNTQVVWVLR